MPHHFAYGANMNAGAMRQLCPRSRRIATGRLLRHRFAIMPAGYANLVADPVALVRGVIYDVPDQDLPAFDRSEGLSDGLCTRLVQTVFADNGPAGPAFVYTGFGGEGGAPLEGYVENVIACAKAAGFPHDYIKELERHLPLMPEAPAPAAMDSEAAMLQIMALKMTNE